MEFFQSWLPFALGSAFFAALTAIFGKLGVAEMNSTDAGRACALNFSSLYLSQ